MADIALTEITAPNSSPVNVTDYQAQNNLINAALLDPEKVFHIDFENDEIPRGSIIQLGGTILKAVNAVTISGAQTNYVKINATTKQPSYVANLVGVTWSSAYNGYYDASSPANLYIFDEATAYFNGDITVLHRLYSQIRKQVFEELGVTKPNWSIPAVLGVGKTVPSGVTPICKLDTDRIAYFDSANNLQTLEWDQAIGYFNTLGAALAIAGGTTERICKMADNSIAYLADTTNILTKYDFDGANWAIDGAGLVIAGLGEADVCFINDTDVGVADEGNAEIRVYRHNGATFAQVGSGLAVAPMSGNVPRFKMISSNHFILNYDNSGFYIFTWDGSSFTYRSHPTNVLGAISDFAILNDTDIVAFVDTSKKMCVFRYNHSDYSLEMVGELYDMAAFTNVTIDGYTGEDICLFDDTADKIYRYRFINTPKVF